jgi:small subunit ribosomal protein S13
MLHFIDSHIPFKRPVRSLAKLKLYQLLGARTGLSTGLVQSICAHTGYHPTLISGSIRPSYVSSKLKRFFAVKALYLDKNVFDKMGIDLQKHIKLQTYRGRRHLAGYPAHGQRTRSNARTKKKMRYYKK